MIDWMFLALAMAVSAAGGGGAGGADNAGDSAAAPASAQESAPASVPATASATGLTAEPQTPTGQFTTATEVRPILEATRANWVAVREYDGRDLVYVTHLFSWRCGLYGLRISVNGGPAQDWPLPPCHTGTAQPNAITGDDGLPYWEFPLGHVQSLQLEILYDDLGTDSAQFERAQVLMP